LLQQVYAVFMDRKTNLPGASEVLLACLLAVVK